MAQQTSIDELKKAIDAMQKQIDYYVYAYPNAVGSLEKLLAHQRWLFEKLFELGGNVNY